MIRRYKITSYSVYKEEFVAEIDTDELDGETPEECVKRLRDEGELSPRTFDGEFIDYLVPDNDQEWTMQDIDRVEEAQSA